MFVAACRENVVYLSTADMPGSYDHVIVNDDLETAYAELESILAKVMMLLLVVVMMMMTTTTTMMMTTTTTTMMMTTTTMMTMMTTTTIHFVKWLVLLMKDITISLSIVSYSKYYLFRQILSKRL